MKFYRVTNIFDLKFLTMKRWPFYIQSFEICTEMHFVSLFFLNKTNITASLLMIHLKCTVINYANLNSSSINKPFLNYGSSNILFPFFDFLFMFILTRLLSKTFWKNYHFLMQILKIHFKVYYIYRILVCQTLWYWNSEATI